MLTLVMICNNQQGRYGVCCMCVLCVCVCCVCVVCVCCVCCALACMHVGRFPGSSIKS